MDTRRTIRRRLTALVLAPALVATLGVAGAQANPGDTADNAGAVESSVVFTLTTAAGTEEVVSLEEFAAEILRAQVAGVARLSPRGGASTNAEARIEGNWYKTSNIYFNRSETTRIAAGAGVIYLLPAGIPNVVVQAIRAVSGAVAAWAGIAIAANACVGIKTPITIGPRVPLPIYHRSGFCY